MTLAEISFSILVALQSFLGVEPYPREPSPDWEIVQEWTEVDHKHYETVLESRSLVNLCKERLEDLVEFPTVYMANHSIRLDNRLVYISATENVEPYRSTHGVPIIPCKVLAEGKVVTWKVNTNSTLFKLVKFYPEIKARSFVNLFGEYFEIFGAGALVIILLISFFLFRESLSKEKFRMLIFQQTVFIIFILSFSFGIIGLGGLNLIAHKVICITLWIGVWSFLAITLEKRRATSMIFTIMKILVLIVVPIVFMTESHDVIQLGIVAIIPFALYLILFLVLQTVARLRVKFSMQGVFELIGVSIFYVSSWNETFLTIGLIDSFAMLPVGILSAQSMFFFSHLIYFNKIKGERASYLRLVEKKNLEKKFMNEKSYLIDGVVHDLRSPIGLLNIIKEDIRNGKKMEGTLVLKSLERINDISKRLDGSAKKEGASCVGLPELKASIESVISEKLYATKNIEINLINNKKSNKLVRVDLGKMESLLSNFLNNSIEAYAGASGVITIELFDLDNNIKLLIKDNGKIVPDLLLSRLGNEKIISQKKGGMGLGVFDAASAIKSWDGEVLFEKNKGKGLIVIIKLPLA